MTQRTTPLFVLLAAVGALAANTGVLIGSWLLGGGGVLAVFLTAAAAARRIGLSPLTSVGAGWIACGATLMLPALAVDHRTGSSIATLADLGCVLLGVVAVVAGYKPDGGSNE